MVPLAFHLLQQARHAEGQHTLQTQGFCRLLLLAVHLRQQTRHHAKVSTHCRLKASAGCYCLLSSSCSRQGTTWQRMLLPVGEGQRFQWYLMI